MSKSILYPVLILLFSLNGTVFAQSYNKGIDYYEDDAALWLNFHFEKKLTDNIEGSVDFKNRFRNNITEYGLGYVDLAVNYSLFKFLKLQVDYAYGKSRNLNGFYSDIHRGGFSVILKRKLGSFTFTYRNMLQCRFKNLYVSENGMVPVYYERNKLTVKYDINKRFETYLSEELYLPFNQTRNKGLSRSRSAIGLIYNVTKKINIEGFFIYQHELNAFNKTNRDFIYGIGYSHQF